MDILKYPVSSEKAIRMLESDNVISFVVDIRATRSKVKREIENKFNVKVKDLRIVISPEGKKRAYITLKKNYPAIDIATQLGLM